MGGGGTDLPSYYKRFGGFVVAGAIDKYIFVSLNRTFADDYFLKYSIVEHAQEVQDIEHPIIREILGDHQIGPAIEVVTMADIPAGTGLGSSGSFAVGLLRAVYAFNRIPVLPGDLAEEAINVEVERLDRPTGKQDQYIAAFGGLSCFEIEPGGRVNVSALKVSNETLHDLDEHLVMFFTGYSRDADSVLSDQKERSESGDEEILKNLHFIKEIGYAGKDALERGDAAEFGNLMHEHWLHKRKRSASISNPRIDRWYDIAREAGALGGKLVGAGAGGFLLFFAKDRDAVRQALSCEGLNELRFSFDHDGSTVLVRG
jgi:D-glycero-alpha-D-manno-heptose-7-phosphate kinase